MVSQPHLPELVPTNRPVPKIVVDGIAAEPSISEPLLQRYYRRLLQAYGPQHWWPGRSRFEIIVGAILTQNTSWVNVQRAIRSLRREKLLAARAMETTSSIRLQRLIRSSGYFRQKARALKSFLFFLRKEYGGSLTKMFRTPTALLRQQLLGIYGIGRETADSILLYAGGHAVFVVDAYARRILHRHGMAGAQNSYEQLRRYFEQGLPADPSLYNEFHALIVRTGKDHCRKHNPRCGECPLQSFLPGAIPSRP